MLSRTTRRVHDGCTRDNGHSLSLHVCVRHVAGMRMGHMVVRVAAVRWITLTVGQWRNLSATAAASTACVTLGHETLVESVVASLRVTEMSVSVMAVAVNELSYF